MGETVAVSVERPERVLDVGSASGTESSSAVAKLVALAVAVDISKAELDELSRRGLSSWLLPVQADAGALPFREGSFDSIRLHEVLEHVADPARVLSECRRCLRDDGELSLSVPTAYTERIYWRLHPQYREQSTHRRIFSYAEITQQLRISGLQIEDCQTIYFVPMLAWVVHCLLRTPADHTGRLLRNQWVDRSIGRVVGGAVRIPLVGAGVRALSRRYGKSWWFSCVKVPSL